MRLEVVVPWIPCSKKNEIECHRIAAGARVHWRPGPTPRATGHELALRMLFVGAIARLRQKIGDRELDHITDMARESALDPCWKAPASGAVKMQRKARIAGMRQVITLLQAKSPPFAGDVRLEVVEHIGDHADEDHVTVIVELLEAPPKRKRTGRRHDLVNTSAIICDALQGAVIGDDRHIVDHHVHRTFGRC